MNTSKRNTKNISGHQVTIDPKLNDKYRNAQVVGYPFDKLEEMLKTTDLSILEKKATKK